MEKKYYKVSAKAGSDTAEIFIYGVIGDSWFEESVTARQFVSDLRALEESHRRINVHINSPGGSVFDGLPIFNALQTSKAEIHTYNDGLAASMGAVILMAGTKVHSAKNALIMLHSPSTYAGGNARDMQNAIEVLNKVQNSLVESVSQKVSLTKAQVESKWFDYEDHWITAEEAEKEGLVDELIEQKARIPEKTEDKDFRQLMAEWKAPFPVERKKNSLISFFENLIQDKDPDPVPDPVNDTSPETEIQNSDMDLTHLRTALGMSDTATESDVLANISVLRSNLTTAQAELATAKADLQKAQGDLTAANAELEDLRNEPGADPASVDPPASPHADQDPPAGSFHEALVSCMNVLKH